MPPEDYSTGRGTSTLPIRNINDLLPQQKGSTGITPNMELVEQILLYDRRGPDQGYHTERRKCPETKTQAQIDSMPLGDQVKYYAGLGSYFVEKLARLRAQPLPGSEEVLKYSY